MTRIGRRVLLRAGFGVGVGFSLTPSLATSQDDPGSARPSRGDLLVKAGDSSKTPLAPADITPGAKPIFAWAMDPTSGTVRSGSRLNQLLVLRLAAETLTSDTRSRAADGVIAYTAICTHEGCEVDDWFTEEQLLHCSCHGSKFDPKDSARVVEGEAPRALPALPLTLDDGRLLVAGPLTARVRFGSA